MTEKRLDYYLLWNNYYQVIELDDEDTDYLRRLSPTEIIKMLNEQQATINKLKEENEYYRKSRDKWRTKAQKVDYWKHKSLELYKLLRGINLSDKEWEQLLNIINESDFCGDEV